MCTTSSPARWPMFTCAVPKRVRTSRGATASNPAIVYVPEPVMMPRRHAIRGGMLDDRFLGARAPGARLRRGRRRDVDRRRLDRRRLDGGRRRIDRRGRVDPRGGGGRGGGGGRPGGGG